ncbi:MAG: hypothetical protein INR64_14820 [Caulobacteraceae bacterium]|nr:hypothetical protein [Caulobacter sp.]
MPFNPLTDLLDALVELNDLKRITSAGRTGSIATRLFQQAWSGLAGGAEPRQVAAWTTGRALAAARLGDLDEAVLVAAGVAPAEAQAIVQAAIDALGPVLDPAVRAFVAPGLGWQPPASVVAPPFVEALCAQPRAGITCPGKPRIMLEPPENHGEHCLMVAVYGVVLSTHYGADPTRVFLAALAHHFHNAGMPDSGFTGEVLLGPLLETVMAHHAAACLRQLAPSLRDVVEEARAVLPNDATAEGRAFHAADVLDRVLQLNQYMRAAALTPERMLGEMELVHAGPVKDFQDNVLRQAGLLP